MGDRITCAEISYMCTPVFFVTLDGEIQRRWFALYYFYDGTEGVTRRSGLPTHPRGGLKLKEPGNKDDDKKLGPEERR